MKSSWKKFTGNKMQWDSMISEFGGSYRQCFAWGEHKKETGWKVYRYFYNVKKETKYAVQLVVKDFILFKFIYIPGGVNGNEFGHCPHIRDLIFNLFKFSIVHVRLDSNYSLSSKAKDIFRKGGWNKSIYKLNTGHTCEHILDNEFPELSATSKWRYTYRRSTKYNNTIIFDICSDKDSIRRISREMQSNKKIYLRDSPENILSIIKEFEDKIVFASCLNDSGKMIGFRAAILHGDVAVDMYAAIDAEGRKTKAGYFLLIEIMKECRKRGIKKYNLGGVEMIKNPGVAKFKVDSGAKSYEFVGEWEYSNLVFFRYVANFLIFIIYHPFFTNISFLLKIRS